MDAILVLFALCLPWVLAVWSGLVTTAHTAEEIYADGGPIWRYLSLPVCDCTGYLLLLGFGALQVWLAIHGYALGDRDALCWLVAIRLTDCLASHWLPWLNGRRPNPGLATSALYAADAAVVALVLAGCLY